jgi:hypothetical protein
MDQTLREIKQIRDALVNIDVTLQLLIAQKEGKVTSAFVNKKIISQRLNVPSVTIDKLLHQGIVSGGSSGLVEGKHYCKVDPEERNSSKFLFDPHAVMQAAWKNFQNV